MHPRSFASYPAFDPVIPENSAQPLECVRFHTAIVCLRAGGEGSDRVCVVRALPSTCACERVSTPVPAAAYVSGCGTLCVYVLKLIGQSLHVYLHVCVVCAGASVRVHWCRHTSVLCLCFLSS